MSNQTKELIAANKTIAELQAEIVILKEELAWFRRQVFGAKTERFVSQNPLQYKLELDIEKKNEDEIFDTEEVSYTRTKKSKNTDQKGHGRCAWPAHLRREQKVIQPDFDTTGYTKISEKVTETLQYTPPRFWVLQEVRGVYKKDDAETTEIRVPPLPLRAIEQGNVGNGVIAQLLVDKCTFHQPLYRLAKKWEASSDVHIPESNLYDWFAKGCFWFEAIRREMLKKITGSGYVQLDESTLRVKINEKKGKCHLGNMIVVHSPLDKLVVFTYRDSKDRFGPQEVLGNDFKGVLQTDCCPSYNMFASSHQIVHAGCNAHSRRYFEETLGSDQKNATHMLELYQELFAVEKFAAQNNYDFNQRLSIRQEKSKPIIESMKTWLDNTIYEQIPKGKLGKAVAYSLNHWKQLTVFLEDGRIELSNNDIENVIRLLAMGRKNFMFAGSVQGAKNLATIYSIMATCRLNNINPYDYTLFALDQLPSIKSSEVQNLIPTTWAEK